MLVSYRFVQSKQPTRADIWRKTGEMREAARKFAQTEHLPPPQLRKVAGHGHQTLWQHRVPFAEERKAFQ